MAEPVRVPQKPRYSRCSPGGAASPKLPPPAALDEPQNDQKKNGAQSSRDDRIDDTAAKMNAEAGKQPAADQGTRNSNTDIGDETESGAADDFAREPARNQADNQDDKNAFAGHEFSLLEIDRIGVDRPI
jgi:hypothetical protein